MFDAMVALCSLFWLHTSYDVPHAAYSRTITKLSETAKARKETMKAEGNYDKIGKKEVISFFLIFIIKMLHFQIAKYEATMKELAKERQEQHLWTARFESRLAQAEFKLHQQQGFMLFKIMFLLLIVL